MKLRIEQSSKCQMFIKYIQKGKTLVFICSFLALVELIKSESGILVK